MKLPDCFLNLARIYRENGYHLYMVGGTSRDYLLDLPVDDWDFATDAPPEAMIPFLHGVDTSFIRFGCLRIKGKEGHIDITTFREEGPYSDHRHPDFTRFVGDMKLDSFRRDFTINAIYIDESGQTHDFHGGLADLEEELIRFIGDPYIRIREDPLRILRAERFSKRLGFRIEEKTAKAMEELKGELSLLNPDKVLLEKKKG